MARKRLRSNSVSPENPPASPMENSLPPPPPSSTNGRVPEGNGTDHRRSEVSVSDILEDDPCYSSAAGKKKNGSSLSSLLRSKLPVLNWLPNYKVGSDLVSDVVAGLTVGLTVIPQGIAYGVLAELPAQYGLYSAFVPGLVYLLLGTCPQVTVGPVALMAVMCSPFGRFGPAYAVLLTLITGIIVTLCGVLRLGFLVDFFSVPVIAGFVSAAAVTIASNQVRGLLGIAGEGLFRSELPGVLGTWHNVLANISFFRWRDTMLAVVCAGVLLTLKESRRFKPESRFLREALKFSSTARNALVVVAAAALAYALGKDAFVLTGEIEAGLPTPKFPSLSATYVDEDGETRTDDLSRMLSRLGGLSILLPLVAVMEHMAIAKAFSSPGKSVDASQELLSLGFCNLLASLFSSFPVTASFGRTAVNASSGARTPLGGLVTSSLVLLALAFLMPYCALIPKAALAAVIVCAVVFTVEYHVVLPMWRSKRSELIPALATFFSCLFWALDYGILLGIAVSLCFLLADVARPRVEVRRKAAAGAPGVRVVWAKPDRGLLFPAASHFKDEVDAAAEEAKTQDETKDFESSPGKGAAVPAVVLVVIDCSCIASLDFTAAERIKEMLEHQDPPSSLVLYGLSEENLAVMRGLLKGEEELLVHAKNAFELQKIIQMQEQKMCKSDLV